MNPKLATQSERQGGVFSHRDALDAGYSIAQIRAMVRAGRWRRLCRGQYTALILDPDLPPWALAVVRHRLAMIAALRSLAGEVVVSHQSAIVVYGLPTWGLDLSRVHVTRGDTSKGRIRAGVDQHSAKLPAGSIWLRGEHEVVSPARAVTEVAATVGFEPALVIADEALRIGLLDQRALGIAVCDAETWPGSPAAKEVLAFCDHRAGSVGESRLRLLMDREGLPTPILQAPIYDDDGCPFAFVDFLFPEQDTVVEFDGRMKYGDGAAAVVVREKIREDRIRAQGKQVVRVGWADLGHPHATATRIRRAFARSEHLRRTA